VQEPVVFLPRDAVADVLVQSLASPCLRTFNFEGTLILMIMTILETVEHA